MPNQPWWQPIVHHAAWLVMMSLVMGWYARSRMKPRRGAPTGAMVYPTSMLALGLVCVGFFLVLAVWSYLLPGKDGSIFISLFFVGFAWLGAPLVAEYFRVRLRLEPGGLRYQSLLGRRGILPWSQIASVRYSQTAKWFRLDGRQGEVIRVSAMLTSLPQFAQVMLQMAPQARMDSETREVLEATAAGSPPSIWG